AYKRNVRRVPRIYSSTAVMVFVTVAVMTIIPHLRTKCNHAIPGVMANHDHDNYVIAQEERGMSAIGLVGREMAARELRVALADERYGPPADHINNGEENEYRTGGDLNYIANFSKGLPHDDLGEVVPGDYIRLIRALFTGDPDDFDRIPLGTPGSPWPGALAPNKLTNPQAGLAFALEGPDPQAPTLPPAPRLDSAENAAEMGELYWMALLRDVPFTEYGANAEVAMAAAS